MIPLVQKTPLSNDIQSEKQDRLLDVIRRSLVINKHVDFFRWLQEDVRYFLPHDVLVAAWGDFSGGKLNYDIASSIPEICTRKISVRSDMDPLFGALHRGWQRSGEQWYAVSDLPTLGVEWCGGNCSIVAQLTKMSSVVVHGVRDKRSKLDCLYAFFSQARVMEMDQFIISLLLPHIDAALRRVECLVDEPNTMLFSEKSLFGMSVREHEIITWVGMGKTNEEIGLILAISPNTVKSHLKKIFSKLNVSSRAQVVSKYQSINK